MINTDYLNEFNSPIRKTTGKAELYTSSVTTKSGVNITLDNVSPQPHTISGKITGKETKTLWNDGWEDIAWSDAPTDSYQVVASYSPSYWTDEDGPVSAEITFKSGYRASFNEAITDDTGNFTATDIPIGSTMYIEKVEDEIVGELVYLYFVEKPKGKNLFNVGSKEDYSLEIYVDKIENNSIYALIRASNETCFINTACKFEGGTYSISSVIENGTESRPVIRLYNAEGTILTSANITLSGWSYNTYYKGWFKSGCGCALTIPSSAAYWYLGFAPVGKVGETVIIKDIQVEKNAITTPYVPYNVPSVDVYGKNLFKPQQIYSKCYLYSETVEDGRNVIQMTSGNDVKLFTNNLKENTQYTVSFYTKSVNQGAIYGNMLFQFWYSDGTTSKLYGAINETDWTYKKLTSTANKTIVAIGVGAYQYQIKSFIDVDTFQFEEGNTATEYEAYKINSYYGDTVEIPSHSPTMNIIAVDGYSITATYTKEELLNTFAYNDALKEITIDRAGEEGKFFGFDIPQKATINLLDKQREINITDNDYFKIYFNINENEFVNNTPIFFVSDVKRDETTNVLTIVAKDNLLINGDKTVSELGLNSYTIREFANACAKLFGLALEIRGIENQSCFDTEYIEGANFEGTETIRDALKYIAEVTQTICYVSADKLIFRRLDKEGTSDLTIEKKHYFSLENHGSQTLGSICHTTALGDNVSSGSDGITQYVRDNPFWELREDIASLVDNAVIAISGISINQFDCKWRGNFLTEIGDKIDIVTKDDNVITTYLLNDSISYKGGYSQKTKWTYEKKEETPSNPTSLGEVIKQTYAKVDKANKQIDIVASETEANKNAITSLQINTSSINASVTKIENDLSDNKTATDEEIASLKSKVDAQITSEDVTIAIQQEMSKGTSKVETSTGFTFNDEGLTVSKSNSEITTQITEDGMNVKRNNTEVLTANSDGVKAVDLHAETYLIIGKNSRFEDYGSRTGCFWIGG